MQCCTYSKWVHLRCSLPTFSKFRSLGSSHFWSCVPGSSGDNTVTSSSDSSSLYISTFHSGPSPLIQHTRPTLLQTSYPPSAYFVSSSSAPSPPPHAPGCFSTPPSSSYPPDSLRVLQWNAGDLRARSTEVLHFRSFYLY